MALRTPAPAIAAIMLLAGSAAAQLRVATWNISFYSGGRIPAIQTSVYGSFDGRSMSPDVILGQEFMSQAAVNQFLSALNGAFDSPGDWSAAPFIDGPDTDNAFFYRTSRVVFLGQEIVSFGGPAPAPPRHTIRYDVRLVGYEAPETVLSMYSTHMKAGSSSADQQRRLVEAQRVRDDVLTLTDGRAFLIGGDFNIQTSSQAAYQTLLQVFVDPIRTPGSWNNNGAFRFVHTQDPIGPGGMDDRHDQILIAPSLVNLQGFEYLGDATRAYSTTTWNDPFHSYRSWGNDGTSFDVTLRVEGNTMVGPAIAQALIDCANGAGHLPVFLDFLVPPQAEADILLDFGTVAPDEPAMATLTVTNSGDVTLWSDFGISDLMYELSAPAGFSAPAGLFFESAGGDANTHIIAMDTSTPGLRDAELLVLTNAPDQPVLRVRLVGMVADLSCPADLTGSADPNDPAYGVPDGVVDAADFFYFLDQFIAGNLDVADLTGSADPNDPAYGVPDGAIDAADFFFYLDVFVAGCP
ncbi:MAG: hypothetical protein KIT24_09380 [Phycisphaeraceae bacterium]|nr:hypothetical protein [Phycisphaeraceae bacterium]